VADLDPGPMPWWIKLAFAGAGVYLAWLWWPYLANLGWFGWCRITGKAWP